MRIMVVDDHATNRELCRIMLSGLFSQFDAYENGEVVVASMQEMDELPDIIILDVMMPVKDGFATAKDIREAFPEHHIPILFLSVLNDQESYQKCLSYGDDYIPKPIDKSVLVAKVQAHYRIARMHSEMKQQRDELSHFHEQVKYDYTIAESIFTNLMDEMGSQLTNIQGVNYISTPSTVFNGDLIVVAKRPHGGVYIMIADATGHGLPAAISAIPASRAFFSMAAKGLSLGEIVTEVNDSLVRFLPMGMMLAASVFEVKNNGLDVSWWGGGLPDSYVLDADRTIQRRLISSHMPLGVLGRDEFEVNLVNLKLEEGQQIVSYTDGVTEAENNAGEQFGQMRLEQALVKPGPIIETLYEEVKQFSTQRESDDVSILLMDFPIQSHDEVSTMSDTDFVSQVPSKSSLFFPKPVLSTVTVMAEVRQHLTGVISGGADLDLVCSVLSELFANAIEHGLLLLDSKLKDDPDGFYTFYQLREERLQALDENAWVKLDLEFKPAEKQLVMQLEHNGEGFDVNKHRNNDDLKTHGRGIVLVSELCQSLSYFNEGRGVTAVYGLNSMNSA
ncbi:response regulator [Vibrio sp. T187]|uniref:fused response regulator/phosphatase n=1 Tax=Vibrio TaxID=662 RepID=UPI0010C98B2F|nr:MULTISPECIES: fused response regulator/phosphatase [Vibrio]MBW3695252.1 response regulator [Vibrio sp. T187]